MMIKNWLILEKDDLGRQIRNYSGYRFSLLISAIIGFAFSFLSLWQKTNLPQMKTYDQAVINFVSKIKSPGLVSFFNLVTNLGGNFFVGLSFAILVLILVKIRRKRAAVASLISILGSAAFIYLFKHFFARPRPVGCWENDCYSFPSGHSTIALYFYGLLDYLIFRFLPISFRNYLVVSILIVLVILLTAASRLFLQLHFLSDVIAGFFLGGAWLLIAILLIDILYHQV